MSTNRSEEIRDALRAQGYYKSPTALTFEQFSEQMRALGQIKKPTEIRPGGPNPILESGRPLLPHNDCNYYADYIVWYCRNDGGAGDRTFIVDTLPLYDALTPDELDALARVHVSLPNHEGGGTTVVRRRSDGRPQLFYVPWALFHDGDPQVHQVLRKFHSMAKTLAADRKIQGGPIALTTGEFLIVDDARFMHGREAVPTDAPRHLYRCYIKAEASPHRAA